MVGSWCRPQDSSIEFQMTGDSDAMNSNEDLADRLDADALDVLQRDFHPPPTTSSRPELDSSDSALSSAPPPESVTVRPDASHSTGSDVVIDHFPFGQPGAPVPGMQRGPSIYETTRDSLGDSLWAPFKSQCDWEFACWAKMRGPTSTAVTELLAIPEVSPHRLVWTVLLTRS